MDLSAKIKSVTNQNSVIREVVREANHESRIENFVKGEANCESRIEILGLILANQIRQDESRDSRISDIRGKIDFITCKKVHLNFSVILWRV